MIVACPHCSNRLSASHLSGESGIRCPRCRQRFGIEGDGRTFEVAAPTAEPARPETIEPKQPWRLDHPSHQHRSTDTHSRPRAVACVVLLVLVLTLISFLGGRYTRHVTSEPLPGTPITMKAELVDLPHVQPTAFVAMTPAEIVRKSSLPDVPQIQLVTRAESKRLEMEKARRSRAIAVAKLDMELKSAKLEKDREILLMEKRRIEEKAAAERREDLADARDRDTQLASEENHLERELSGLQREYAELSAQWVSLYRAAQWTQMRAYAYEQQKYFQRATATTPEVDLLTMQNAPIYLVSPVRLDRYIGYENYRYSNLDSEAAGVRVRGNYVASKMQQLYAQLERVRAERNIVRKRITDLS